MDGLEDQINVTCIWRVL